jgi:hypothetical protein
LHFLKEVLAQTRDNSARWRQVDAFCRAKTKLGAEMTFESFEREADGRLLDVKAPGSGTDPLGACDLTKNLEEIQIQTLKQRRIDAALFAHGQPPDR